MKKIWIISDTHFNHEKLKTMGNGRPDNYEELIMKGLKVIKSGDTIIHLGDFCIGKDEEWHMKWYQELKGVKKILVPSFGSYQFKKSTVQFYYKELYNKDITGLEAINIALSDEKAGELASDIIFKENALNNWYNCTKKHNLQGKLDIINLLLK